MVNPKERETSASLLFKLLCTHLGGRTMRRLNPSATSETGTPNGISSDKITVIFDIEERTSISILVDIPEH